MDKAAEMLEGMGGGRDPARDEPTPAPQPAASEPAGAYDDPTEAVRRSLKP